MTVLDKLINHANSLLNYKILKLERTLDLQMVILKRGIPFESSEIYKDWIIDSIIDELNSYELNEIK